MTRKRYNITLDPQIHEEFTRRKGDDFNFSRWVEEMMLREMFLIDDTLNREGDGE